MTTPAGLDEQRILVVPVAGRFEGVRVFLRSSDILYAFLGSKAFACVHAPWVGRYKYNDRTVYARSRTLGLVRVRIAALTRLRAGMRFATSSAAWPTAPAPTAAS